MKSCIAVIIILLFSLTLKANEEKFLNQFYSGKWANAKAILLDSFAFESSEKLYYYHGLLSLTLHETEIVKCYADSLSKYAHQHEYKSMHHLLNTWYYLQHKQYDLAEQEFKKSDAYSLIGASSDINIFKIALQGEIELTKIPSPHISFGVIQQSINRIMNTNNVSNTMRMFSALDLFEFYNSYSNSRISNKNIVKNCLLQLDNLHHLQKGISKYHPVHVWWLLVKGKFLLHNNREKSIELWLEAIDILRQINDGIYGIFFHLSESIHRQLSMVYELKYQSTQNTAFLNDAIIWEKQNLWLRDYSVNYEGFYFHRRQTAIDNTSAEKRLANLHFKFYKHTRIPNHLTFALTYDELLRHKGIMQRGKNIPLYKNLKQILFVENGGKIKYVEREDLLNKVVSQTKLISRYLKANEALIIFNEHASAIHSKTDLLVQIMMKEDSFIQELNIDKQYLNRLNNNLTIALNNNDIRNYKINASLIYKLVLKDILLQIPKQVKQLYFIMPGIFESPLVIESLITDEFGNNFSNLNYLFNSYQISYAASITHFIQHHLNHILIKKVNVLIPDYRTSPLPELSDWTKTTASISPYFPLYNIEQPNKSAIISKLLAGNILQVVAHANGSYSDYKRPMIYTGISGTDSIITDTDIELLNGNTTLTILAACKSNSGRVSDHGIIDGFTRAFLTAGNAGVISTIRNVREDITNELLGIYYRHLASGKNSVDALHEAKSIIKMKYPNPIIWNAFIYEGAPVTFAQTLAKPWLYTATLFAAIGFGIIIFGLLQLKL
ncbi:MAG: CHAT domain-containing protein [Bacteroidia bacterium]|jgi:CHAT domain-containing protein|nr:CHAT domain-containing protein [Bacteroidia bacterium]